MNWKDAPHLFANGKFKIEFCGYSHKVERWYAYSKHFCLLDDEDSIKVDADVEDCTLIARPISDMTDEEVIDIGRGLPSDDVKSKWAEYERSRIIKEVKNDRLSFREARKILSIGVYPFDDDTDVIFKPKK